MFHTYVWSSRLLIKWRADFRHLAKSDRPPENADLTSKERYLDAAPPMQEAHNRRMRSGSGGITDQGDAPGCLANARQRHNLACLNAAAILAAARIADGALRRHMLPRSASSISSSTGSAIFLRSAWTDMIRQSRSAVDHKAHMAPSRQSEAASHAAMQTGMEISRTGSNRLSIVSFLQEPFWTALSGRTSTTIGLMFLHK